jgi:DNA recombination protein RmuC
MGFRTIAIEKRSSEVWQVLGEAKAEFGKYAAFIDKVSRQLATAQNTLEDASKRTRAVERKLRKVETAEGIEGGGELLALPGLEDEEEAA